MKKVLFSNRTFLLLILSLLIVTLFLIAKKDDIVKFVLGKKVIRFREIIKYFPFTKENALEAWEEKVLKGKVVYEIEKLENLSYVRADSRNTASALYYKLPVAIETRPIISWKWRVDAFPAKQEEERIEATKEEDFAARVYVIFPAAFFTNSKVIEYIWAESIPEGAWGQSGYTKNIKVIVLESGKKEDWKFEKRNIYEDYLRVFGEEPKLDIGAIAFMTDADSTKTFANAVYDEIKIGYEDDEN